MTRNRNDISRVLRITVLWLGVLAILSGCGTIQTLIPGSDTARLRQAESLEAREKWADAARIYGQLADAAASPLREEYRIRAAGALFRSGAVTDAKQTIRVIGKLVPGSLLASRLLLLKGRIALAERRPMDTLRLTQELATRELPLQVRITRYELRVKAHEMRGQVAGAVDERIALDSLLADPARRRVNQEAIWELLSGLQEQNLVRQRDSASRGSVLAGWLDLAYVTRINRLNSAGIKQVIRDWQKRYPRHPALDALVPAMLARQITEFRRPGRIALLLPLGGQYQGAATAIRDGFLAAFYADPVTGARPLIRVYDSSRFSIWALYQQAIRDGAELVVGPLAKDNVTVLARSGQFEVPVLALNYAQDELSPEKNFFQMSLSPEDEARQAAEQIWLAGHSRGLVLVPEGTWGERVNKAFSERWAQFGGEIAETQTYNAKDKEFSRPVSALLNVDESRARYRNLKSLLNTELEFDNRRRKDVDFIFLGAFPRQARQIRPGLRFFHAGDLPVYSTSHAYRGTRNVSADRDMDGIRFGDMPAVLGRDADGRKLLDSITSNWADNADTYIRLYALGIDAYRIIPYLEWLSSYRYERFHGATGNLHIDEGHRIRRQLTWAQFRKGRPVPITPEHPADP